jgi:hypothetical protein
MPFCMYIALSVFLYVCFSVHPSFCMSASMWDCPFIFLFLPNCMFSLSVMMVMMITALRQKAILPPSIPLCPWGSKDFVIPIRLAKKVFEKNTVRMGLLLRQSWLSFFCRYETCWTNFEKAKLFRFFLFSFCLFCL